MLGLSNSKKFKDCRNSAIVCLLAFEGLKAHEIINIGWQNFYSTSDGAAFLSVEGLRSRSIALSEKTIRYLRSYRKAFDDLVTERQLKNMKTMFVAFQGRDEANVLPTMTRHGLKFIVYEVGEKAEIQRLNTETLRHYAIKHLISRGFGAEEIMSHLGLRRIGNIAKHLHKELNKKNER